MALLTPEVAEAQKAVDDLVERIEEAKLLLHRELIEAMFNLGIDGEDPERARKDLEARVKEKKEQLQTLRLLLDRWRQRLQAMEQQMRWRR